MILITGNRVKDYMNLYGEFKRKYRVVGGREKDIIS